MTRKSYFHKPHLGSLPHDRRTNDPEKLQERIDEIDRRVKDNNRKINELKEENDEFKEINKKVDEYNKIHKDRLKEAYEQRKESNKEIWEHYQAVMDSYINGMNSMSSEDQNEMEELMNWYFGPRQIHGLLTNNDVEEINHLGDLMDEFANGYVYGDHDDPAADTWQEEALILADVIREDGAKWNIHKDEVFHSTTDKLANEDNFFYSIKTKHPDGTSKTTNEMRDDIIKEKEKEINRLTKENADYSGEKDKCTEKIEFINNKE